jgi:hypothetical protein
MHTVAVVGGYDHFGHQTIRVADSWEAIGWKVDRIDRNQEFNLEGHDMVFLMDVSEDYSSKIPDNIGDKNKVVAYWSFDVNMPGGLERSTNIARKCDIVFNMNHEQGVQQMQKMGIDSYWMPCGAEEGLRDPLWVGRDFDVVMIGNPNSQERRNLWELLDKNYYAYAGKCLDKDKYNDLMSRAKLVVNQPTEPFDNIIGTRGLEGMAFGAMVLTKEVDTDEWEKLGAEDGKHFVYWNDFDDLREKMNYYLDRENERLEIARAGHLIGIKHNMRTQVTKMEQIILTKFYERL